MNDISIIICSQNRENALRKTLNSLSLVSFPKEFEIELLLIDNSSDDNTYELMQSFNIPGIPVRAIQAFPKGLSVARNKGVAEARGKVLLFTDDDVRFPDEWIFPMTSPILSGEADAVAGGVSLCPELRKDWLSSTHRSVLASTEKIDKKDPERIVGANMAISKEVFNKIPAFDTELGAGRLGAGEETLFSLQMKQSGFKIKSAFDTEVMHCPDPARVSRDWFAKAAGTFGKSDAYISYHWKHRRHAFIPLFLGLSVYRTQLDLKNRLYNGHEDIKSEMPLWEFKLLRKIHRLQMHLELKNSDFKYELHGFTKID
ncbi:MAG: glycosyltransferase [Candidatus Marinimicrobia bacterium]|nr:glycosyltransferase [Candidatus Neomarinimicrobiota bacterium]